MTTELYETVPVMQDVRTVQREARRLTAIQRWPIYAISALLSATWMLLWQGGHYSGKWAGIMLIAFGGCVIGMTLLRKKILRVFLGNNTPMILARGESGLCSRGAKPKIIWIAGLVAGGVLGFAAQSLLDHHGEDTTFIVWLSGFVGAGIIMTCVEWQRTRLWEFIAAMLLQIVTLAALLRTHDLDDPLLGLFLAVALFCSALFAISFFFRWRRWVKSLPETVKTGEA